MPSWPGVDYTSHRLFLELILSCSQIPNHAGGPLLAASGADRDIAIPVRHRPVVPARGKALLFLWMPDVVHTATIDRYHLCGDES